MQLPREVGRGPPAAQPPQRVQPLGRGQESTWEGYKRLTGNHQSWGTKRGKGNSQPDCLGVPRGPS